MSAVVNLTLDYALRYAAIGWPVLPTNPRNKLPLGGNGLNHASTDPAVIRRWFERWPAANIGVALAPAGLAAIDIDPRNGGSLEAIDLSAADTLCARTGGGGWHLLVRAPTDATLPGTRGPGIDVKHNGYIVVEPSVHRSGNAYSWLDWDPLSEPVPAILDAPGWLYDKPKTLHSLPRGSTGQFDVKEAVRAILTAESYHNSMIRLAAHFAALRVPGKDICTVIRGLFDAVDDRSERWHDRVRSIPSAVASALAKYGPPEIERAISISDFYAYAPDHKYLYIPTLALWPAASVDTRVIGPPDANTGKPLKPSLWLDANRSVEQMTWSPDQPQIIEDQVIQDGGWIRHPGARVFNLYRAPPALPGDPNQAEPWLDHVRLIYPNEWEHIVRYLAQRVQFPGRKINHALVLGGPQGIGKDTILEAPKHAVGHWNWADISPTQMLGRFNGWCKAVVVRVSEARDLGDVDRFAFYDHSKAYIAAPPDVIRVDEKNLREHPVANVMGVIITTNHRTDGIYLPPDDRRHFVAWSEATKEDFEDVYWRRLWNWYGGGGIGNVCAYLRTLDLSEFDPKAPPPKTPAFHAIVAAGTAPEDSELADVVERAGTPAAITLTAIIRNARAMGFDALALEFEDRKARRQLPHKLERVGYVSVHNPDATDGLWRVADKRQVVYARKGLVLAEQIRAVRAAW